MYLTKIPRLIQWSQPQLTWHMASNQPELYVTFDDGPTPDVTPWVLDQLATYEAKATFFLIGECVRKHPGIVHQVIDTGHTIGNHTQHHLDGWKTPLKTYLKNSLRAAQTIKEYTGVQTRLFRPPYGHISRSQSQYLRRSHRIVMMDVVSGDFDREKDGDTVAETVIKQAEAGSIIVFHDSQKAWPRLQIALPKVLAHFHQNGFAFKAIPTQVYQDTNLRSF